MSTYRVTVRAKPGASRTRVGGRYGQDTLVVAVTARAVDGAATAAVLTALADAFGVPRSGVRLVSGASARTKIVEFDIEAAAGAARLADLLG